MSRKASTQVRSVLIGSRTHVCLHVAKARPRRKSIIKLISSSVRVMCHPMSAVYERATGIRSPFGAPRIRRDGDNAKIAG